MHQKTVPLPQVKYKPAIVERLFKRINEENQGRVDINKIAVVAFHYGNDALTTGRIQRKEKPETFANDLWRKKAPKTDAIRA